VEKPDEAAKCKGKAIAGLGAARGRLRGSQKRVKALREQVDAADDAAINAIAEDSEMAAADGEEDGGDGDEEGDEGGEEGDDDDEEHWQPGSKRGRGGTQKVPRPGTPLRGNKRRRPEAGSSTKPPVVGRRGRSAGSPNNALHKKRKPSSIAGERPGTETIDPSAAGGGPATLAARARRLIEEVRRQCLSCGGDLAGLIEDKHKCAFDEWGMHGFDVERIDDPASWRLFAADFETTVAYM
jgi:hypothetical protein